MYVCLYACMYVYVCMHVCGGWVGVHVCFCVFFVCVCPYTRDRSYTLNLQDHESACMYVCMYVYMYACMYVCMHVCMYACMHVCGGWVVGWVDLGFYVCVCVSIHKRPKLHTKFARS
jgi:hypothetical protein